MKTEKNNGVVFEHALAPTWTDCYDNMTMRKHKNLMQEQVANLITEY